MTKEERLKLIDTLTDEELNDLYALIEDLIRNRPHVEAHQTTDHSDD